MSFQLLEEAAAIGRSQGDAILPKIRTSALGGCLDIVASWITRADQRRALRELAEDGRMLTDVGLTREQALREAGKPFWSR
jgi:uncharacterized protein YjiS (DUF1127 family)